MNVTYEACIESVDQLFSNERVTDEELLEDDKEDGIPVFYTCCGS